MQPSDLAEIFRTRLGSIQTRSQVELFEGDLLRSNLDLMDVSLKEARAMAAAAGAPEHARDAVMTIYRSKLAELAQLFPVFFVFESAYRSFVAARLSVLYGDDQWWKPVRDAFSQGRDPHTLRHLGNLPARRDVVDTVFHLIKGMGPGAAGVDSCYDLLEGGTLSHVERLIAKHWTAVDSILRHDPAKPKLTSATFGDLFRIVRLARNDAYHHRSVRQHARVVAIVEQLLDMLDMSLSAHLEAIASASVPPLRFAVATQPRHS